MLEIAQKLCRNLSGSKCSAPHMSSWVLKDPSQSSISVDVADIGTGGAAAIAPANVKIYGSYFSTGLECHGPGGMSAFMSGYGAGAGAGAGWGIPFVGAKGVGKLPDGIKKKVLSAVGSAAQGKARLSRGNAADPVLVVGSAPPFEKIESAPADLFTVAIAGILVGCPNAEVAVATRVQTAVIA